MISSERKVEAVPEELLPVLSDMAKRDLEQWTTNMEYLLRLSSSDVAYIHEDGEPLLLIGAIHLSLLDPAKELWMFGSRNIRMGHLRTFRRWFLEWCETQKGPIYARADTEDKAKYIRFFGLVLSDREGAIETYEVPSCYLQQ